VPKPCSQLVADHREYMELVRQVESLPGIKKVFIRSGIRFDYLLADKSDAFFHKLVQDHISGQLKVAPEHCAPGVLACMGKPTVETYDRFRIKYEALNEKYGKNQFLVPYLMSSHPGSTMDDAAALALYTKRIGLSPEQVQDFYPTPGTASTVMYYTGLDPFTGKEVYTATDYREKQLQRALLQWRRPENRRMLREAMNYCSEEGKAMLQELLGQGRPSHSTGTKQKTKTRGEKGRGADRNRKNPRQTAAKNQQKKGQNGGSGGKVGNTKGRKPVSGGAGGQKGAYNAHRRKKA